MYSILQELLKTRRELEELKAKLHSVSNFLHELVVRLSLFQI